MKEERLLMAMTEIDGQLIRDFGPDSVDIRKRRRHPLRIALIAAAVVALLTTAALAISPTLREVLQNALGGFAPHAQDMADQGISCTDQGIQVKVVSTLCDGNVYRVYFTAQDLTGNRLDEFTQAEIRLETPSIEDVRWAAAGKGGASLSYDSETKAVLFYYEITGDGPPAGNLTLTLSGERILPGWRADFPVIDQSLLAAEPLQTQILDTGRTVLVPEQNPSELDSELCDLSSYGFGDDGVLHIQVRLRVPVSDWTECTVGYGASSRTYETDQKLGQELSDRYNQTDRWDSSSDISYEEHKVQAELNRSDVLFTQNGVLYCDVVTGVTPDDMHDAKLHETLNLFLQTKDIIDGHWSMEVPFEVMPNRTIDMAQSTTINGVTATTLYLTKLSASLESDSGGTANHLGYPLAVFFSDGSHIAAVRADGTFHAGGYNTNHWTFEEPIDPDAVTAISIGQWYVPIENGVAQSGHWLDEVPQ